MSQNYRIRAIVHLDVTNAESEAAAREQAFAHVTAVSAPKRGPKQSGARCSVTGVSLEPVSAPLEYNAAQHNGGTSENVLE